MKIYNIMPVAAPRQTRRDKFVTRPCVAKYRAFKDEVRLHNITLPESYHVHFIFPVPKSYSKKKKKELIGTPHTQRPDKDNLEKALLDALYVEDSHIWTGTVSKWWGEKACIVVQETTIPTYPLT